MNEDNDILAETDQEKRIEMVLTDAYGEDEMQEAFCCYLGDHIKFPFEAKIRNGENSRKFTALRFTSITPHKAICEIDYGNGIKSRISLTEIEPIDKDSSNNLVINDYLKFINENYE